MSIFFVENSVKYVQSHWKTVILTLAFSTSQFGRLYKLLWCTHTWCNVPYPDFLSDDVQMYLLCSLAIFSMPLLWPSLPAHRIYTLSIPILLPIAHMGLTGISLSVASQFLNTYSLSHCSHMGLTVNSLSLSISSPHHNLSISMFLPIAHGPHRIFN